MSEKKSAIAGIFPLPNSSAGTLIHIKPGGLLTAQLQMFVVLTDTCERKAAFRELVGSIERPQN